MSGATLRVATLRSADAADIPAMHRVRMSVRENRLTSTVLTEADYAREITATGRGWVMEVNDGNGGEIVGFAVGNLKDGSIWALFVDPAHEGRGYGRRLHNAVVTWLFDQGLTYLWLTTGPDTRAFRFYKRAGWELVGKLANGEVRMELAGFAG